jgi:hypothetical protein
MPSKGKSSSFLKKRTKRLLSVAVAAGSRGRKSKSLLVLFFRKELLSYSRGVLPC